MITASAVLAFALGCSASASEPAPSSAPEAGETARLFQRGVNEYASGSVERSLASFREVLRRDPRNEGALAAVRRIERETSARPSARSTASEPAEAALDRFFLVTLPRWFYFERTLGDGFRDAGTSSAINARVAQLLAERRHAAARSLPFGKELQLRALLRRAPVREAFEEA